MNASLIPHLVDLCVEKIAANFGSIRLTSNELDQLPEDIVAYILFLILQKSALTPMDAIVFSKCRHSMVHDVLKWYEIDVTRYAIIETGNCKTAI